MGDERLEALERRLARVERKLGLRCRECGPECRCGDDCECEREADRSDAEKVLGSVVIRSWLMRHRDDGDDDIPLINMTEHVVRVTEQLKNGTLPKVKAVWTEEEMELRRYPLDDWKPVAHWWEHPTGARVWLEYVKYEGAMVQKWRASRPGREEEHLGPFGDVREAVDNALSATAGAAEAGDGG
jgi:hypothetical protein